jgi:hypothetical protein
MMGWTEEDRQKMEARRGCPAARLTARPAFMAVPGSLEAGPSSRLDRDGRLPTRGRHYDRIHLEPSEHYQGEFELHLDNGGNGGLRVGLDVGDLAELRGSLPGGPAPVGAGQVREFLIGYLREAAGKLAGEPGTLAFQASAVDTVIRMLG